MDTLYDDLGLRRCITCNGILTPRGKSQEKLNYHPTDRCTPVSPQVVESGPPSIEEARRRMQQAQKAKRTRKK